MTSVLSNNLGDGSGVEPGHMLMALPREDLDLIMELVLQSGSLKGLAKSYRVSYPTIRGRVDKVIGRLQDVVDGKEPDPLREMLATLVERGELSTAGARQIHQAAEKRAAAETKQGDKS